MEDLGEGKLVVPDPLNVQWYKQMIATAILYKAAHKISRGKQFQQAQANIAAYLVAVVADQFAQRISLDRIWDRQQISRELEGQLEVWALQVETALRTNSGARMISEQAKRPECWDAVRRHDYAEARLDIPELA
jgi:hypothetical protein